MTTVRKATSLRQLLRALPMWGRSFSYLRTHRLRAYHLAGPIVLAALALAGWWFAEWLTTTLTDFLHAMLPEATQTSDAAGEADATSNSWGHTWNEVLLWSSSRLDWIVEWGVLLFVLWLKVKVTKYLLITLMAPFMSALAAAVCAIETGTDTAFNWKGLVRDLWRGLRISLVLLMMELALGVTLWTTGFLLTLLTGPHGVLLSPVLIALSWAIGAYFFGAAVYDAVYEQAGLDWRSSIRAGWTQRSHMLAIGGILSLLLAIPFIGPYIAALIGPIPCTAAAARLFFTPSPPIKP